MQATGWDSWKSIKKPVGRDLSASFGQQKGSHNEMSKCRRECLLIDEYFNHLPGGAMERDIYFTSAAFYEMLQLSLQIYSVLKQLI